jgi:DNA/RNA-binding domain of Phe-tRNA-synthetase-like protein
MVQLWLQQLPTAFLGGLVEVSEARLQPSSPELWAHCAAMVAEVQQQGAAGGDRRRQTIRDLLRAGGFKPAGRSKPAQEYLHRTIASEGTLPRILNAVDLINAVSARSGLPISLVSLDRVGRDLVLRLGRSGERYVFNAAGQELDCEGLLCLCQATAAGDRPVGSPVKDSMFAKVDATDRNLLACVFASPAAVDRDELQRWCDDLAVGFRTHCQAAETRVWIAAT